jgi:hypothetical protein
MMSILLAHLTATRIFSVALQSGRSRARIGVKFKFVSSAGQRVTKVLARKIQIEVDLTRLDFVYFTTGDLTSNQASTQGRR